MPLLVLGPSIQNQQKSSKIQDAETPSNPQGCFTLEAGQGAPGVPGHLLENGHRFGQTGINPMFHRLPGWDMVRSRSSWDHYFSRAQWLKIMSECIQMRDTVQALSATEQWSMKIQHLPKQSLLQIAGTAYVKPWRFKLRTRQVDESGSSAQMWMVKYKFEITKQQKSAGWFLSHGSGLSLAFSGYFAV